MKSYDKLTCVAGERKKFCISAVSQLLVKYGKLFFFPSNTVDS